jgi:hypothetical protein
MNLIHRHLIVMMVLLFHAPLAFNVAEGANSEKKDIKISYISKHQGDFDVKKFRLNHPIKISRAEIINHLVSLRYKENYLGNKEEPVFSSSEIKKLFPVLMKAFAGVNPDKIIHIELKSPGGITSGDIFSFRKYLNWRFDSIRGESFYQRNNVREWNVFAWKLIPQKGQLYFKSSAEKGKRIQRNWLVANLDLPVSEQGRTEATDSHGKLEMDSLKNKRNPELEKKLEHLKYLYDKKLLNKEEYKIQQGKLFDELL